MNTPTDATLAHILGCHPFCGDPNPAEHGGCAAAECGAKRLAALRAAGFEPVDAAELLAFRATKGHAVEQAQEVETLRVENERLREALNTPELDDFAAGVVSEAQHQRERWGAEHDAGKAPEDWFWLIGYLAGKALHAAKAGDFDKTRHHTISTAAALANWHAAITGRTTMRPGIGPGSPSYPAAKAIAPQGCVSAAPTGCVSDTECAAAGRCLEATEADEGQGTDG